MHDSNSTEGTLARLSPQDTELGARAHPSRVIDPARQEANDADRSTQAHPVCVEQHARWCMWPRALPWPTCHRPPRKTDRAWGARGDRTTWSAREPVAGATRKTDGSEDTLARRSHWKMGTPTSFIGVNSLSLSFSISISTLVSMRSSSLLTNTLHHFTVITLSLGIKE